MSTPVFTPPSFRMAFGTQLDDQPLGVQQAHKTQWNAITDIYQSIIALNAKTEGAKSSAAEIIENLSESSETIIQQVVSLIGYPNNQIGNTAYATKQSDYGAFILFSGSSPIAVTLTTLGILLPWYCSILNFGSGTATLTPASGSITYTSNPAAATMPVAQGNVVSVVYDGTNFWGFTIFGSSSGSPSGLDFSQIFQLMGA